jgi:hypothetical protein
VHDSAREDQTIHFIADKGSSGNPASGDRDSETVPKVSQAPAA